MSMRGRGRKTGSGTGQGRPGVIRRHPDGWAQKTAAEELWEGWGDWQEGRGKKSGAGWSPKGGQLGGEGDSALPVMSTVPLA